MYIHAKLFGLFLHVMSLYARLSVTSLSVGTIMQGKERMVTQENKYWEDSFRVYEKGVAAFKYPHVKDIWQAYLAQFVQRYGGTKLERARDLFRQALNEVS